MQRCAREVRNNAQTPKVDSFHLPSVESHLRRRRLELLQAVLQALHLLAELGAFLPQQVAVELHELQETLGCGVVEVFLILLVLGTHLIRCRETH